MNADLDSRIARASTLEKVAAIGRTPEARILLALLPFVAVAVVVTGMPAALGLRSATYDHSREIAAAGGFADRWQIEVPAFAAAVGARFPDGSTAADLEEFVAKLHGNCRLDDRAKSSGRLLCVIPRSGTMCFVRRLAVDAEVDGKRRLSRVRVREVASAC